MIDRVRDVVSSLKFQLGVMAVLHVNLGLWSLFIEAEGAHVGLTARNVVFGLGIAYTVLMLARPHLLLSRFTWGFYLAYSSFCLLSSLPYSSNLYFLWVFIDVFMAALFFAIPGDDRKQQVMARAFRGLICAIFAVALIQKLVTPTFMDGSFYFQAFSSGFFGFQFAPFAERWLLQDGLSDHLIMSTADVLASMTPHMAVGNTVPVSIHQSTFLLHAARFMVWSTIVVEGACLLLLGLNRREDRQYLNHLALFAFLLGTYSIVPIIYDWGLTFAMLGLATASRKWKPYYVVAMVAIFVNALVFAWATARLFWHYESLM